MDDFDRDSMLESFIYEMNQLLEQLENNIVQAEGELSSQVINEIFRIMHTIKGSAAMMLFDNVSTTAHAIEDLFFYLRENKPEDVDTSKVTDLTLGVGDFVKEELEKLESGLKADGDSAELIGEIKEYIAILKGEAGASGGPVSEVKKDIVKDNKSNNNISLSEATSSKGHRYHAHVNFLENSEMENVRAFTIVHNLANIASDITHEPENLLDETKIDQIRENGFKIDFISEESIEIIREEFLKSLFIKDFDIIDKGPVSSDTESTFSNQSGFNTYKALVRFEEGCEMENVRGYGLKYNLENEDIIVESIPEDLIDQDSAVIIRKDGLQLKIITDKSYDDLFAMINQTIYLKNLDLEKIESKAEDLPIQKEQVAVVETKKEVKQIKETKEEPKAEIIAPDSAKIPAVAPAKKAHAQYAISVSVQKLDLLLNLVGELVTSEAMVTQNPDLDGLSLDSFTKEASQLRKIIKDVQDTVMSMRMVPLSPTFFKMHRIVRDMCKQLNKEVALEIIGENTEVDKNIIEHIADPLMHIIRNSVDHGIEMPNVREEKGKDAKGTVILEAKNSGGDVLIYVRDDGAGLNRDKILAKAKKQGLLVRPESEYGDREIYNFIFLPGFSTNEAVTSFSGRGVGMDVVTTNLEMIGGAVIADSVPEKGSVFTLKIPLTLAIIEGMTIKLGESKYTVPIVSIIRSFKAKKEDLLIDPSGNEMIMVRGECYNLVRLKDEFQLGYGYENIEDGIVMMLENGTEVVCIHVDELIGEQQVVVKNIPKYIRKTRGISGCAILGNGDISLIIDVAGFFDH